LRNVFNSYSTSYRLILNICTLVVYKLKHVFSSSIQGIRINLKAWLIKALVWKEEKSKEDFYVLVLYLLIIGVLNKSNIKYKIF